MADRFAAIGSFVAGIAVGALGIYVVVGRDAIPSSPSDCDGIASVDKTELSTPPRMCSGDELGADGSAERLRSLQDELEELRREAEKLRAQADRRGFEDAIGDERPRMYPLSREERLERIERCEYFTESPAELTDEVIDALELTPAEQVAYAEALEVVSTRSTRIRNEVWRDVYGTDVPKYDQIMKAGGPLTFLEKMQGLPGALTDADLHRIVEEEHAGLRQRRADESLSPWERFKRAGLELPDRLQDELASRVGSERAHEIRAFDGGWPGGHGMLRGCSKAEP